MGGVRVTERPQPELIDSLLDPRLPVNLLHTLPHTCEFVRRGSADLFVHQGVHYTGDQMLCHSMVHNMEHVQAGHERRNPGNTEHRVIAGRISDHVAYCFRMSHPMVRAAFLRTVKI